MQDTAANSPVAFAAAIVERLCGGSAGAESALGEVAAYFDAVRATLFRVSLESGTLRASHEYCAPGEEPRKHLLQNVEIGEFPYANGLLFEGRDLVIGRLDDLPEHADQERTYFAVRGRYAAYCVPLKHRERVAGFLAVYGRSGEERAWPEWTSSVLRLCGQAMLAATDVREAPLSSETSGDLMHILDTSPLGVFVFEQRQGELFFCGCNKEAHRITQGTAERFVGLSARQIYPDKPEFVARMQECLRKQEKITFETDYTSRGTRERFMQRFTFAPASEDTLVVYAQNISETRRLEKEARDREHLINNILENSAAVIYVKDYMGRYLRINRQFEEIFGLKRDDVLGITDYDILPRDTADVLRKNDLAVLASGRAIQYEEVVHHGGSDHTYISVKFPIASEDNEAFAICGISTDITARKEIETALTEARREAEEANAAKSMFLATISHEMRTPLNAIVGMSDLLSSEIAVPSAQSKLQILNQSARNLLHLITDILDFEKIQAGRLEIVERSQKLRPMLAAYEQLFSIFSPHPGVRFVLSVDPAIPENLVFDAVRMEQVLGNLVSNAAKYTLSGSVKLTAEMLSRNGKSCRLRFSVEDTGPGIPGEYLSRLGEPFLQILPSPAGQRGTGLGLAIVGGILALLGSRLEVDSALNRGSRFSFTVSLDEGGEAPVSAAAIRPDVKLHLLIVDDNDINLTVLGAYLHRWGWTYDSARDGREAVDAFDPDRHDAVVMDILMPVMDGIDAAHAILSRFPGTRIVALTADLSPDNLRRTQEAGFTGLLGKPFDPAVLQSLLAKPSRA